MKWDVLFRADADAKIGIGHMRRCQALIEGFGEMGLKRCAFVSRTPKTFQEWLDPKYPVFRLRARHFQEEIAEIKKLFSRESARFTIIDRYGISSAYLEALKQFIPVLLSLNDDVELKDYPVDGIINYNVYAGNLKYPSSSRASLFLGPQFVPIRKEFRKVRRMAKDKLALKKVFVSLGGYAKTAHLEKVRQALEQTDMPLEVAWASGRTRAVACKMSDADLAISAGGVTTYELACLGVPALLVTLAHHQESVTREWQRRGVALDLGPFNQLPVKALAHQIVRLLKDTNQRKKMSEKGRRNIDGRGAQRLAQAIIKKWSMKKR
jgi:UDP-2,4-diacetamido-2,4,6-trideoxy-beta-L-altropyranose hydrolase